MSHFSVITMEERVDTVAPSDPATALTVAEESCAKILCEVLGFELGATASIGFNDGRVDCLVFSVGELRNGDMVHSPGMGDYHFSATATIYMRERAALQRMIMDALEVARDMRGHLDGTNVFVFRLNGVSGSSVTTVQTKSNGDIPCHTASLTFDVAFRSA